MKRIITGWVSGLVACTAREEISEALSAYAARAGDGVMVERFWRLRDAPASAGS